MKQWETPQVVIDKFIPNKYVSACIVPVNNDFNYIDLADPDIFNVYHWGRSDGFHQSRENVDTATGNTVSFQGSGPDAWDPLKDNAWYKGITIYRNWSLGPYYNPVGTYDVYVTGSPDHWTATIYTQGSADAETVYHKNPVNHS